MLRRFAWTVLGFNLLVIAGGAFVRATGSGAGCGSHWPLCNGTVIPREPRIETLIELSHRTTSGLAAIAVFVLVWLTFRNRPVGHPARGVAVASGLLMLLEALIGAGLVVFEYVANDASWARVWWLASHLANTFLLLAALSLTAWRLDDAHATRLNLRRTGAGLVMFLLAMVTITAVTGAITSLGDTLFPTASLSEGLRRDFGVTSHFLERLRVIHPAIAVATAIAVLVGASALARRNPVPDTVRLATAARVLVVVQIAGGVVNLVLLAPIWMQLIHLLLADITWIALVLLGASVLAAHTTPRAATLG